ncbi:MAG: hypothetical protein KDN22_06460 [Verrucomicrobiae bacterium]|nr:hypothetical protein [Verrucomicrobiae bacterium]
MPLSNSRPDRKGRCETHVPPNWVGDEATYFITINCRNRGKRQLSVGDVPGKLFGTVGHYCGVGRWCPEIFLLMPDHLHALIVFSWADGDGINAVLSDWKRYTARNIGIEWQRDYFDHRIRNDVDHAEKWAYIRDNPVRKGFVASYDQWPYVWFPNRTGWSDKPPEGETRITTG